MESPVKAKDQDRAIAAIDAKADRIVSLALELTEDPDTADRVREALEQWRDEQIGEIEFPGGGEAGEEE